MTGRETKRRWGLVHVNSVNSAVPWIEFTARGRAKAERKLLRILAKRRGVALLWIEHPEHFALRCLSEPRGRLFERYLEQDRAAAREGMRRHEVLIELGYGWDGMDGYTAPGLHTEADVLRDMVL